MNPWLNPAIWNYILKHYVWQSRYQIDLHLLGLGYHPAEIEIAWQILLQPTPKTQLSFNRRRIAAIGLGLAGGFLLILNNLAIYPLAHLLYYKIYSAPQEYELVLWVGFLELFVSLQVKKLPKLAGIVQVALGMLMLNISLFMLALPHSERADISFIYLVVWSIGNILTFVAGIVAMRIAENPSERGKQ